MIIFGQNFFGSKCVSSHPKKVQKKQVLENLYFSKDFVLKVIFCLENLRKDERHLKKKERRKKRKTQQTQKIEGQMKNSEAFFLQKKWSNNQEEILEVSCNFFEWDLLKKTIFSNEIFFEKNFSNAKKTREMIKTNFFWRSWRDGYFPNTQRLPENEMWKNVDAEAVFVENILRSSKDSDLSLKKEFQKKEEKRWQTYLHQKTEIQKINSWRDLNKWLFCKKKSQCILFERTRLKITTRKTERNNNGDRAKTVSQTRDEEMKKGFFRKHEKLMKVIFQEKELIEQKKHKRVNIHKKESK